MRGIRHHHEPRLVPFRAGYVVAGYEIGLIGLVVGIVFVATAATHWMGAEGQDGALSQQFQPLTKLVSIAGGQRIVVGCGLAEVRSLDLAARHSELHYRGQERCVWHSSRDGRTLAVDNSQSLFTVTRDGNRVVDYHSEFGSLLTSLSLDGTLAAATVRGTNARCWDLTTGEVVDFELKAIASRILVDGHRRRLVAKTSRGIEFYEIDPNPSVTLLDANVGELQRQSMSDDGRWLISFDARSVSVYDLELGRMVWKWKSQDDKDLVTVDISADSCLVAIGLQLGKVIVNEVATGKRLFECEVGDKFRALCFSSDRTAIFAGHSDGTLVRQSLIDRASLGSPQRITWSN